MNAKKLKVKKPKAYSWCHKRVLELYDCGIPDFNSIDNDIMSLYKFIQDREDAWDEHIRLKIKHVIKWSNSGAKLQMADSLEDVFKQFDRLYNHAKKIVPWGLPPELKSHEAEFVIRLIPDDYKSAEIEHDVAQGD